MPRPVDAVPSVRIETDKPSTDGVFYMAYVYLHRRLDTDEVFYVGIGMQARYARVNSTKNRNKLWRNIVNKHSFSSEIISDGLSWEEACSIERRLIAKYGRVDLGTGTLANMTDGGDGILNLSASSRKVMSAKAKDFCRLNGNSFSGKKHSVETRRRISQIQNGAKRKPLTESTKRKIGLANKGRVPPLKGKKDPKGAASRTGVHHPRHMGEVECYALTGELFRVFSCNSEAAKFFGIKNANFIRRVIVGDRKHWHGYVFKLKAA